MIRKTILVLGAALLLAACSSGPRAPLFSPFESNGVYGYSDGAVEGDRVSVTYTGANRRGFGYTGRNSEIERKAVDEAVDLALWRAAQIAKARGFKGFTVAESRIDVRTYAEPGYYDDTPFAGVGIGAGRSGTVTGLGVGTRWGPSANSGYSGIKVTANLVIDLRNDAQEKFYDADDVITQARQSYPSAESPRG
jgi:hypothetical protein